MSAAPKPWRCYTSTSTWSPRAATPRSGTRVSRRICARAARAVRTSRRCWPRYATPRANQQTRGSLAGRGVLAQVPDQADDILRDEPADGAAGVHADDDPAAGVKHEPGRLQVPRVGVGEGPGSGGDGVGVGAVPDRELQAMLGDQVLRGGFVVDRQRDDRDAEGGQVVEGALERAELRVAVRAPRSPVEQDDPEVAGQGTGQLKAPAAGQGYGELRERISWVQQCRVSHAPLATEDTAS